MLVSTTLLSKRLNLTITSRVCVHMININCCNCKKQTELERVAKGQRVLCPTWGSLLLL